MAAGREWLPSDADVRPEFFKFVLFNDNLGCTYRKQEDPQETPSKGVFVVRYVVMWHGKLPYEVCVLQSRGHVVGEMQATWRKCVGIKPHGIGIVRFLP